MEREFKFQGTKLRLRSFQPFCTLQKGISRFRSIRSRVPTSSTEILLRPSFNENHGLDPLARARHMKLLVRSFQDFRECFVFAMLNRARLERHRSLKSSLIRNSSDSDRTASRADVSIIAAVFVAIIE